MLDQTSQPWPDDVDTGAPADIAGAQLRSYVERVEHLDEEISDRNSDKRDIYAEAKANGFDVKALKAILKIRKEDADKRREHETIVDLYMRALGMVA